MRFKLLLFTLLCSLAAIMPAKAETLTVYDGTAESNRVPAFIYYWDDFSRSEFVIPASALEDMTGGTITAIKFYTKSNNVPYTSVSQADFYLTEVDNTSLSAYVTKSNSTIVYHGTISIVSVNGGGEVTIAFSTPYTYGGGNLLIGSENTTDSGFKSIYFYGQTVSGASIAGSNSSSAASAPATQQNFIPKTTFTYTPGVVPNPKPTNLAVSDITAHSAKASWTGNDDAQSYNLRYRRAAGVTKVFEESFETFPGSWTIIDSDGDGNNWTQFNPMNFSEGGFTAYDGQYGAMSRSWLNSGALTPDNWLISPQVDLGGVLKYYIVDDGGYQETYRIYVSTTGTNIADFQPITDDLLSPASNTWTERTADLTAFEGQRGYIAFRQYNCTDQDFMIIDAVSIEKANDAGEWTTISPATSPQDITGLDPETEYEVQVQAVYADGSSDWTNSVNFTTTDGLDMPTNLAISEITHNSAVATWEGTQESYNLRYRTPAKADVNFFEGFENGLDAWTLVNTDGDSYNWQVIDPETAFTNGSLPRFEGTYCVMSRSYAGSALNPDQWMISPEIEDLGGMLRYYVMDDGANYQETYRIYVCTTGSTDIADFVPVTEDMLTPNSAAWTEQAVDLSAYAGQSGRIAFRHYNCTDQDFMFIDAIGIYANEVPAGEWTVLEGVTSPADIEGLDPETEYEVQVQGIFGENTTNWTESELFTTLMKRTTLAEICQNGVITEGQNEYVIADKLIGVYADDVKGILWCKDQGNASVFSTSIKDGQVDFLKDDPEAQNGRDWDQSNWIALHFSTPTATNNIGQLVNGAVNRYIKPGTVKGKLIDDVNYALRMDLDQLELVTQADDPDINPNYIPNVYCPANFMPTNLNIWGNDEDGGYTEGSDQNYFFMNPKIQEICEVTYAQWDAINGYFTVPTASGFDGAFYIGTGYNVIQSQNFTNSLQDEHIYKFKAIVQRSDKDNYGPKNVTTPATGITLYPVDLDPVSSEIPTAINTIRANGEVVGVEYVNSLGIVSKTPFQGVNIVVTRYSNGATTTMKKVFK